MGWFASGLLLLGAALVGRRDRWGFIYQLAGNAIWAWIGFSTGMYDLTFVESCFCIVNIWSFFNWGRTKQSAIGPQPVYFTIRK